ncbi:MAG: hypothetical protein O7B79_09915 [SAR324 cluster bacterium]|nr:hypothetical protein [SAR324 cluster bacterium]
MLVKIIAAGHNPKRWQELLQQLRLDRPDLPFTAGMFASPDALEHLEGNFFPSRWRREGPDFFLCGVMDSTELAGRSAFVEKFQGFKKVPRTVLVTHGLEARLREFITEFSGLGLILDTGNGFYLSDPAFLLKSFPADFPRLRVNDHLTTLRIKQADGISREIDPKNLASGTLIGFSEVEAVLHRDTVLKPRDWLKSMFREEGVRRAPRSAGLVREENGLFLFPGIPLEHIQGIRVGKARFDHLIDLAQLDDASPQYRNFLKSFTHLAQKRGRTWKSHTARIRQAEAKADIPIICGGDCALLRESLAALLVRRGYQRCFTLNAPGEGLFREPSLLLQVSPWARGKLGAQVDAPMTMDVGEEIEKQMRPLDRLLPWRELPFQQPPVDIPPLPREGLSQQRGRLAGRATRLRKNFALEEKRKVVLGQEVQVLEAAGEKLAQILNGAVQTWTGELTEPVRQLLLLSHDEEEAATVMRSLPRISKKRWFDLAHFVDLEAAQNLNLDSVRHYGGQGAMLITPASRERLELQHGETRQRLEESREHLHACKVSLERLEGELSNVERAREELVRHWVWDTLARWLDENRARMARALELLRERHERRWFSRSHVRRALILPYKQDNAAALLEACSKVYPGFNRDMSIVVPYEFEFLDALPKEEAAAVSEQGREEGLAPGGIADRLGKALAKKNETLFADFLQVVSSELTGLRTDLVLIDHSPQISGRILEHLRRAVPQLEKAPAVLLLNDLWSPPKDRALPWPRTRVALLPRMGDLDAGDCTRELRALYPQ